MDVLARGFNKVLIMGNLARDPEIRYTASKQAVAKLTVAVGHQYKGKNGEVVDQTDFIPVVVWGSDAERRGQAGARAQRYRPAVCREGRGSCRHLLPGRQHAGAVDNGDEVERM